VNKPLVSIIIPVYNAEKYLKETVESALNQTWKNKEIIIIDDGSTDNSLALANGYQNSHVSILSQQNRGTSAARNRGLKEAKGDYIQFLDSDDLLSPDKIEHQVKILQNNRNAITISSTIHFKGSLSPKNGPSPYEESFLFDDPNPVHFLINLYGGYSRYGSMVAIHSWLTPRALIDKAGPWNEDLTVDDDGEFFCRVILNSTQILKSEGFNYYRKHDNQINLSAQNNYESLNSRLKSALLKKDNLLRHTDSHEAKVAIYKILLDIAVASYLTYPDLYKRAIASLPAIKLPGYLPSVGGRITTRIAGMVGWRAARFIARNKSAFTSWWR
jgi:glycosyltransferase involved in cell wall biosynthesis